MKKQAGFTLIELIAVIVVLGIIAAVAIPRFVDLSAAAEQASVQAVATNLGSASSLNYASARAQIATGVASTPAAISVSDCDDIGALVNPAIDGTGDYSITAADIDPDEAVECTVTGPGGATAEFIGLGVDLS